MTWSEEVPAGVERPALENIGKDQGRAVTCDEGHQGITGVSKWRIDPEQPHIEEDYGGFGTGYGCKINHRRSLGPLCLMLFGLSRFIS